MTHTLPERDRMRLRALHTLGRTTVPQLAATYPHLQDAHGWRNWLARMTAAGWVHAVTFGPPPRHVNEYELATKALRALAEAEKPAAPVAPARKGDWRTGTLVQPKWEPARAGAGDALRVKSRGF